MWSFIPLQPTFISPSARLELPDDSIHLKSVQLDPISKNTVSIGRLQGDVTIPTIRSVSRSHAILRYKNDQWYLIDNSTYGTYVSRKTPLDSKFIQAQDQNQIQNGPQFQLAVQQIQPNFLHHRVKKRVKVPLQAGDILSFGFSPGSPWKLECQNSAPVIPSNDSEQEALDELPLPPILSNIIVKPESPQKNPSLNIKQVEDSQLSNSDLDSALPGDLSLNSSTDVSKRHKSPPDTSTRYSPPAHHPTEQPEPSSEPDLNEMPWVSPRKHRIEDITQESPVRVLSFHLQSSSPPCVPPSQHCTSPSSSSERLKFFTIKPSHYTPIEPSPRKRKRRF